MRRIEREPELRGFHYDRLNNDWWRAIPAEPFARIDRPRRAPLAAAQSRGGSHAPISADHILVGSMFRKAAGAIGAFLSSWKGRSANTIRKTTICAVPTEMAGAAQLGARRAAEREAVMRPHTAVLVTHWAQ
jgi:hypothetical protein